MTPPVEPVEEPCEEPCEELPEYRLTDEDVDSFAASQGE